MKLYLICPLVPVILICCTLLASPLRADIPAHPGWPDTIYGHASLSLAGQEFDFAAAWGEGELLGLDNAYFQTLHHHAYFLATPLNDADIRAILHIDTHPDFDLGVYRLDDQRIFEPLIAADGGSATFVPEPTSLLSMVALPILFRRQRRRIDRRSAPAIRIMRGTQAEALIPDPKTRCWRYLTGA